MTIGDLAQDISRLKEAIQYLLLSESLSVLDSAFSQLQSCSERSGGRRGRRSVKWEMIIPSRRSLRFVLSRDHPKLQPDIFCKVVGVGNQSWQVEAQHFVLRVWSLCRDWSYRPEVDAQEVATKLDTRGTPERVLMRFHFDKADPKAPGPLFHLQAGGNPEEEDRELCWLHPKIEAPRLAIPPMDLVLLCQLVIANFFHEDFIMLEKTPEWRNLVRRAQKRVLTEYYATCHSCVSAPEIQEEKSLLVRLWNS